MCSVFFMENAFKENSSGEKMPGTLSICHKYLLIKWLGKMVLFSKNYKYFSFLTVLCHEEICVSLKKYIHLE